MIKDLLVLYFLIHLWLTENMFSKINKKFQEYIFSEGLDKKDKHFEF